MRNSFFTICSLCLTMTLAPFAFAHDYGDSHESRDHDRHHVFPDSIPLPDGFQPESIINGHGATAFVGSLKTGGIYAVDLRSGEGDILVEQAPSTAVGLAYDRRSNYLFVGGGFAGTVTVYDAADGQEKAVYQVAAPGTFVNDGTVTRDAVYFTDSFAPVIYRIPLSKNGRLPNPEDVTTIPLSGDFAFLPGEFNSNGIVQSKVKGMLYVVNTAAGLLYQVDPSSGFATQVVITNGDVTSGDGLLLRKGKLYVAQNFLNQISELKLSRDGKSASVTRVITDPGFRIPTAIAGIGDVLYALNARLDVAPPPFPGFPPADPTLDYQLIKVTIEDKD